MLPASHGSVAVPKTSGTFAVFWVGQCQTSDPGVVVLGDLGALVPAVLSEVYHCLAEER